MRDLPKLDQTKPWLKKLNHDLFSETRNCSTMWDLLLKLDQNTIYLIEPNKQLLIINRLIKSHIFLSGISIFESQSLKDYTLYWPLISGEK